LPFHDSTESEDSNEDVIAVARSTGSAGLLSSLLFIIEVRPRTQVVAFQAVGLSSFHLRQVSAEAVR